MRILGSTFAAGALGVAAIAVATPAFAETLDPAKQLSAVFSFTTDPTNHYPTEVDVNADCPVAFHNGLRVLLNQGSTTNIIFTGTPSAADASGTLQFTGSLAWPGGNATVKNNNWTSKFKSFAVGSLVQYVVACDDANVNSSSPSTPINSADTVYFMSTWLVNADGSFTVQSAAAKTTPSVALAGVAQNDGSVKLTATVKKSDGTTTATDATGQID
ncbi:MAG TPA: hypothetical protein VGC05_16470, partial [Mycobacterium sp.]